jgi:hypothetical protein
MQNNREACTKITMQTVRHVVDIAGREHDPSHLRFLHMIVAPEGSMIKGNQDLVIEALADCKDALILFNGPAGQMERARLIAENDHIHNRAGELAYHMELIALLASVCMGDNQIVKSIVREMLSLSDIVQVLAFPDSPVQLRSVYLSLLHHSFIETSRLPESTNRDLVEYLPQLFGLLSGLPQEFVDAHLDPH